MARGWPLCGTQFIPGSSYVVVVCVLPVCDVYVLCVVCVCVCVCVWCVCVVYECVCVCVRERENNAEYRETACHVRAPRPRDRLVGFLRVITSRPIPS